MVFNILHRFIFLISIMPNFFEIQQLRSKYGANKPNNLSLSDVENVVKYFSLPAQLNESLRYNPSIIPYLEQQKEVDLVLLFIDICSFSLKVKDLNNQHLSKFLDTYYDKVIPIIYEYGGEVDKIIGDGIIAIFGQPFLKDDVDSLLVKADNCAKKILCTLEGTVQEVKVALHDGRIKYYKQKASKIADYTIIGGALTDLFRLESISVDNRLNYYCESAYDKHKDFCKDVVWTYINHKEHWWHRSRQIEVNLKGVDFKFVRNFKKQETIALNEGYDIGRQVKKIDKLFSLSYPKTEVLSELPLLVKANTIFSKGGVLSVSLNNQEQIPEGKGLRINALELLFSEIIELLNASSHCFKIEINNFTIQGLYECPFITDIEAMYEDALRVNALKKTLSYKFKKISSIELSIGIGLDWGEIYVIQNQHLGTIYSGKIFEISKVLSTHGAISVSAVFYENLIRINTYDYKQCFKPISRESYYQSDWVNTNLTNWYKENCK